MKITCLSDIHGNLIKNIKPCDLIFICGDIVPLTIQTDLKRTEIWVEHKFLPWLNSLKCQNIVFIAGNHDFHLKESYDKFKDKFLPKNIYLEDNEVNINGLRIYGTPWCPYIRGFAYCESHNFIIEKYKNIPDNIDILLTHCPPKVDNVGVVLQNNLFNSFFDYGSYELTEAIQNKNIKYVFCGHIHSGDHECTEWKNKKLYNVSLLNEKYQIKYHPLVIEI